MISNVLKMILRKEAIAMNLIRRMVLLILIMLTLVTGCNPTPSTIKPNIPDSVESPFSKKVKEPVSSASHQEDHVSKPSSVPNKKAENQPSPSKSTHLQNSLPVFNKENFTLIGVSIGENRATVIKRFGEPSYLYETKSETTKQIHEYEGFTVGYSIDGKVNWISVTSSKIDPLIDEIFVGSSEDKVLQILGKPDHKNEYQLQYIDPVDSLTLKLDIDPFTSIVQSISLFKKE
jgi:hypothetical protein